ILKLLASIPSQEKRMKPLTGWQKLGAAFDVVESIKSEKTQPHIKVVVRPAVPDNNTSWQVFENDQQIINFLQEEAEFSLRNQDKLEQQY
ncbi:hypothetical protein KI387_010919, partial [Taxus chinensis]